MNNNNKKFIKTTHKLLTDHLKFIITIVICIPSSLLIDELKSFNISDLTITTLKCFDYFLLIKSFISIFIKPK